MDSWGMFWAGFALSAVVVSVGWAILLIRIVSDFESWDQLVLMEQFEDADSILHPPGECPKCDQWRKLRDQRERREES